MTTEGYLATPATPGLAVLVLHAWWGLTPFFQQLCDRLAGAGFLALAPDLYGAGRTASTIDEAETLMKHMDNERAQVLLLPLCRHCDSTP